jgi:hypothetical protein
MITFIGIEGRFINLSAIVDVEDVSDELLPRAVLTTIGGYEIEIEGPDVEALFNQLELLDLETRNTVAKMHAAAVALSAATPNGGPPQ